MDSNVSIAAGMVDGDPRTEQWMCNRSQCWNRRWSGRSIELAWQQRSVRTVPHVALMALTSCVNCVYQEHRVAVIVLCFVAGSLILSVVSANK